MSNFEKEKEDLSSSAVEVVYDQKAVDAVFGEQSDGHVKYTTMGWMKTAIVLLKVQIALGVLAMPTVLLTVGAVPGVIVILGVGLLTTWSDYVTGLFKRNHPEVYSIADAGYVLAGRVGRDAFAFIYAVFLIAVVGAGLIPISIAFNTITEHATCTVVWVVIGAVLCFAMASIQTMNRVSIVGWIGFTSIMVAILIVTIAVGVEDRPAKAPQTGPWEKDIHAFKQATFLDGISAIATSVFGYCGAPVFFGIVSEMKDQRQYNKALATCQTIVIATYLTIGIVVYYYCGQYLASPALGSAGKTMQKISYGIALPGLIASVVIYTHNTAKMIFVRILKDSHHLTAKTRTHQVVWYSTVATCTILGFVLAEAIPFFNSLVVLLGALFGTTLCMQFSGWMWLHDNWKYRAGNRSTVYWFLVALNVFLIAFGSMVTVGGTVAGVKSIISSYATGAIIAPFSCADNSGL
ncbi:hypothetical protein P7C73_g5905, partial [Tremellales sp. Uapishka_1]